MKIEVLFVQEYYFLAGKHKLELDLKEDATVKDVIGLLPDKVREKLLDENGNVRPPSDILVNGRSIAFLNGFDTRLKDGDKILIAPRPLFVV